ncbi:MAG TPA: glycosyltransferase family 39 protein [Chitinophagales bacterium]|nr:glycosyltransferase family 39 protein [Chitinophagales bacterium]
MKKYLVLLAILSVAFTLAGTNMQGIDVYDEATYTHLAWNLANGNISFNTPESHYTNRWGIIVPLAFFIKLFGLNVQALVAWPLICFLLLIAANYFFLYSYHKNIAAFSSLLLACNPVLVRLSVHLFPDIVSLTFSVIAIMFLWKAINAPREHPGMAKYGIAFAISFCMALISKESALFLLPFFAFACIRFKTPTRFMGIALGVFVPILLLYLYFNMRLTGNAFSQLHSIESLYNSDAMYSYSNMQLLKRLSYWPVKFLFENAGYILVIIPSLPVLLTSNNDRFIQFFKWSVVILFLTYCFGTISATHYQPILLDYRFWIILIYPASILSAYYIYHTGLFSPKIVVAVAAVSAATGIAIAIANAHIESWHISYQYALMPCLIGACLASSAVPAVSNNKNLVAGIFMLPLLSYHTVGARIIRHHNYQTSYYQEQEAVTRFLLNDENKIIATSPHLANGIALYFNFDEALYHAKIYELTALDTLTADTSVAVYIFLNRRRLALERSGTTETFFYNKVPAYNPPANLLYPDSSHWEILYNNAGVELYKKR